MYRYCCRILVDGRVVRNLNRKIFYHLRHAKGYSVSL